MLQAEKKKTYARLACELLGVGAAVLFCALLGPTVLDILMPFLLAFIMAWAFNPIVQLLHKRLKLTRKLFSFVLVLTLYAILLGLFLFFTGQVISQVTELARAMPGIVSQLQRLYNRLTESVSLILDRLPPEYDTFRAETLSILEGAWSWLRELIARALRGAVGLTSDVALALPEFVIFLTVLVLASCFITADFPNLRENIYGYIGKRGKNSLTLMGRSFRTAVLGYFRSQLIFALVDIAIILVVFFLIDVPYPLPIALILCVLDFLPFFGAGTVLVPWGILCVVLGFSKMGAQLLLLYATLYILRRIFEPRVLGGATGFSSLQMLFAMYAGMKLYGVMGLVIAPIVWIGAVNFLRTGILNGFLCDLHAVWSDIRAYISRPEPTQVENSDRPKP